MRVPHTRGLHWFQMICIGLAAPCRRGLRCLVVCRLIAALTEQNGAAAKNPFALRPA